jgi:hypothetical protein
VESSDIERRRVNASVAWSSMRWDTKLSLLACVINACNNKKKKERERKAWWICDEYAMNMMLFSAELTF